MAEPALASCPRHGSYRGHRCTECGWDSFPAYGYEPPMPMVGRGALIIELPGGCDFCGARTDPGSYVCPACAEDVNRLVEDRTVPRA